VNETEQVPEDRRHVGELKAPVPPPKVTVPVGVVGAPESVSDTMTVQDVGALTGVEDGEQEREAEVDRRDIVNVVDALSPLLPVAVTVYDAGVKEAGTVIKHVNAPPETGQLDGEVTISASKSIVAEVSDNAKPDPITSV
jgi:hypothetical protein